jgi:hypothetical protein
MTSDLSNRTLIIAIGISLIAAAVGVIAISSLYEPGTRAGSPAGQGAAIVGAIALVMSAICTMLKRVGAPSRRNFARHIWLSCIGLVLVTAHTGGNFFAPPALLLLALLALMVLGLWARTSGARHMASTFGSKSGALTAYDSDTRERLRSVIEQKQVLLAHIDPAGNEATFSLTPGHWLRSPLLARKYRRLVHEERALIGTDRSVVPAQAYWRRVHQLIAIAFVLGLLVHIILVTFFAGYVAEGRAIYWWHLADLGS